MYTVNTLIGTIPEQEIKLHHESKDEKFYIVKGNFNNAEMDIIVSEYVYDKSITGRVKVTCDIVSKWLRSPKARLWVYMKAYNIEKVDDATPETNDVVLDVVVASVREFRVTKNGEEILSMVGTCKGSHNREHTLYLCAKCDMARRLKNIKEGEHLYIRGYLKSGKTRTSAEVLIRELCSEISEVKEETSNGWNR